MNANLHFGAAVLKAMAAGALAMLGAMRQE
jgi:hypothetical protein